MTEDSEKVKEDSMAVLSWVFLSYRRRGTAFLQGAWRGHVTQARDGAWPDGHLDLFSSAWQAPG